MDVFAEDYTIPEAGFWHAKGDQTFKAGQPVPRDKIVESTLESLEEQLIIMPIEKYRAAMGTLNPPVVDPTAPEGMAMSSEACVADLEKGKQKKTAKAGKG